MKTVTLEDSLKRIKKPEGEEIGSDQHVQRIMLRSALREHALDLLPELVVVLDNALLVMQALSSGQSVAVNQTIERAREALEKARTLEVRDEIAEVMFETKPASGVIGGGE